MFSIFPVDFIRFKCFLVGFEYRQYGQHSRYKQGKCVCCTNARQLKGNARSPVGAASRDRVAGFCFVHNAFMKRARSVDDSGELLFVVVSIPSPLSVIPVQGVYSPCGRWQVVAVRTLASALHTS